MMMTTKGTGRNLAGNRNRSGLESLLKGGKNGRGGPIHQNRSFHNRNLGSALATEHDKMEMSMILGSVGSVIDHDEDIVIDSGGR